MKSEIKAYEIFSDRYSPSLLIPFSLELMFFPGGEPHVHSEITSEMVSGYRIFITAKIADFDGIGMLAVVKDYFQRLGAREINVYIPYLPGARQDRGNPLTSKVIANMINAMNFTTVTTLDPHSNVMPGMLDSIVRIIDITDIFPTTLFPSIEDSVLVVPDAGAIHRVESLAAENGYEIAYAQKHRDFRTGKLSGFSCPPIPYGKHVIVVDDICDGGGTFLGLSNVMEWDSGQTIPTTHKHLWTTHGIYSQGLKDLRLHFSTIACSDSLPVGHYETYSEDINQYLYKPHLFDNIRIPILPLPISFVL